MSERRDGTTSDWDQDWDLWDQHDPHATPARRAPGHGRGWRRLWWLLAVAAVVTLLMAVGLFGYFGLTLDGNTMVRDRSYTFKLPGRWWPSSSDRGAVQNAVDFYRGPSTAAGRLHVAVTRERKATTLRALEQAVPSRVRTVRGGRIVKPVSLVRLGGEQAIQLDYEFSDHGFSDHGTRVLTRQILCIHDGAVYDVILLAVPYSGSDFDQIAGPITRQVLRTWSWGWRWT